MLTLQTQGVLHQGVEDHMASSLTTGESRTERTLPRTIHKTGVAQAPVSSKLRRRKDSNPSTHAICLSAEGCSSDVILEEASDVCAHRPRVLLGQRLNLLCQFIGDNDHQPLAVLRIDRHVSLILGLFHMN